MKQNNSPWLTQLHPMRPMKSLAQDMTTDIVIVGGGIAGITTLFFLLKYTKKKIILLEGSKIAHGATGHNAGQVVAEFERPLSHIAKEYGVKYAVRAQEMIEEGWELLHEMIQEAAMDIPFKEFIGYSGHMTLDTLLKELEIEFFKHQNGLVSFPIMISRESEWLHQLPVHLKSLCKEVPMATIQELLITKHPRYQAVISARKATLNSALFSEQLAMWCLKTYSGRCDIFEKSFVHGIELESVEPKVITDQATVNCKEIILCTNGFDSFYIRDREGADLDTKFHHLIQGVVGYMTGYLTHQEIDPLANRYFEEELVRRTDHKNFDSEKYSPTYFYVTQRKFDNTEPRNYLMGIGGPEVSLEEREIYFREFDVPEKMREDSISFAKQHFNVREFDQKFFWHGLMGYTRTGVRVVGREPLDPRLLYNLGCNGVGILPSIMGGRKIARHIAGESVAESIFDPKR